MPQTMKTSKFLEFFQAILEIRLFLFWVSILSSFVSLMQNLIAGLRVLVFQNNKRFIWDVMKDRTPIKGVSITETAETPR